MVRLTKHTCSENVQVVIKARVSPTGASTFSESLRDELEAYLRVGAAEQQPGIPRVYAAGVQAARAV